MVMSIYTPLSGAITQERVLDMIANNLANMNTHGFKGDKVSFELLRSEPEKHYSNPLPPANYKVDFEQLTPLIGNEIDFVGISDISKDMSQGPAIQTNNQTDVMIQGEGFFVAQTRDGERFTRNGSFSLSPSGTLVTQSGDPVLGSQGTIQLAAGKFQINAQGEIYQKGQLIDRLLVRKIDNPASLERVGNNYFISNSPENAWMDIEHPSLQQGALEGSNVNAIQNLTSMIIAHRSVEAYQKAIKNYDSIMEKSVNRIADTRA